MGAAFCTRPILAAMMPWRLLQPWIAASRFLSATIRYWAGDRMSDMRNFGSKEPPMMSEKIQETNLGTQAKFRDTGGLSTFHHTTAEDETSSSTAKMVGGAVVVL